MREKHPLVGFCICPDQELNLQTSGVLDDSPTNWAIGPGLIHSFKISLGTLTAGVERGGINLGQLVNSAPPPKRLGPQIPCASMTEARGYPPQSQASVFASLKSQVSPRGSVGIIAWVRAHQSASQSQDNSILSPAGFPGLWATGLQPQARHPAMPGSQAVLAWKSPVTFS